jgi:pimeloyl-ACP methyl ester carboxylesterase
MVANMPVCRLSGLELYYVERGQGEPLIFLNGLAGDSMSWMGQLKSFSRQFRCIAIDNRDVGQSTYVDANYTTKELAQDLIGLCQQLRLGPAHVVGVSMGGMIAQEVALAAPDRVASLVLVNTLAAADDWFRGTLDLFKLIREQGPDTATFFSRILPWWVSHEFFRDSGRTSWLMWLLSQNPYAQKLEGFQRQLAAVAKHHTVDRLHEIRCPVLILSGADDHIMPPRFAQEMKRAIPHAVLQQIPGVGHALALENPVLFNSSLQHFLSGLAMQKRMSA